MKMSEIRVGMKVHYVDTFARNCENGIVKGISQRSEAAFVVYHCDGKWDEFYNYTGALTMLRDLYPGWRNEDHELSQ